MNRAALARLRALEAHAAMHPACHPDPDHVRRKVLGELPAGQDDTMTNHRKDQAIERLVDAVRAVPKSCHTFRIRKAAS